MITNCPNCAAPIEGYKCNFCGTEVLNFSDITPGKIAFIKIQNTIFKVRADSCSINMLIDGFPKFEFNGTIFEMRKEK